MTNKTNSGWISCGQVMPTAHNADCEGCVWLASDTYLMGRVHYKDVPAKNGYAVGTLSWHETGLAKPPFSGEFTPDKQTTFKKSQCDESSYRQKMKDLCLLYDVYTNKPEKTSSLDDLIIKTIAVSGALFFVLSIIIGVLHTAIVGEEGGVSGGLMATLFFVLFVGTLMMSIKDEENTFRVKKEEFNKKVEKAKLHLSNNVKINFTFSQSSLVKQAERKYLDLKKELEQDKAFLITMLEDIDNGLMNIDKEHQLWIVKEASYVVKEKAKTDCGSDQKVSEIKSLQNQLKDCIENTQKSNKSLKIEEQ